MQKITPFLWFNDTAEEAMNFYASIFNNSKIGSITRYGDAGPGPKGKVMDHDIPAGWTAIHGVKWRPAFHVLPSHIVPCEL